MMEGWKKSTLGEEYDVRDGTHDSPKYQQTGFPLITSKNLKAGVITYDKVKYISEDDYFNINKRSKVDVGDVLFAMIGTIGNPVVITEEPNYAIKNVALFKVSLNQNSSFLKYYLESSFVVDKMFKEAKGATQKFVGLGYLRKFPIPIPPLSEQQQIVAILDQAFEAIDQAKSNIETNIENAKELFQSKLNDIFSQKGEGWEEESLGDETLLKMIDGDRGKNYPKKSDFLEEGHCVFMNTGNVRPDGFDFSNVVFITEERDSLLRKGKLQREDVVMTTRGTIGNLGWYSSDIEFDHLRINSGMLIFRVNQEKILPEYLFTLFRSSIVKQQIIEKTSGAAQPQLPIKTLVTFKIPVSSSLLMQKEMVRLIEKMELEQAKLIDFYKHKISNLIELKKSILQKAFAGKLTEKAVAV